jgi:NCAIR mutase (PurE)-related protein
MKNLRYILDQYKKGKKTIDEVIDYIVEMPYLKLKEAVVDLHREIRKGVPEIIYSLHKTEKQLIEIINNLYKKHKFVIASKLEKNKYEKIKNYIPKQHKFFEEAKILLVGKEKIPKKGFVLIITAGTTDIPVAKEASVICRILGNNVKEIYDLGVAGLHRILEVIPYIRKAKVIIVIAGMDGVLPSVIAGLSKVPVIAVPTSTGYGSSFKGLSALLTMLNSCSLGVSVVNIDNGLAAGYIAHLINRS